MRKFLLAATMLIPIAAFAGGTDLSIAGDGNLRDDERWLVRRRPEHTRHARASQRGRQWGRRGGRGVGQLHVGGYYGARQGWSGWFLHRYDRDTDQRGRHGGIWPGRQQERVWHPDRSYGWTRASQRCERQRQRRAEQPGERRFDRDGG